MRGSERPVTGLRQITSAQSRVIRVPQVPADFAQVRSGTVVNRPGSNPLSRLGTAKCLIWKHSFSLWQAVCHSIAIIDDAYQNTEFWLCTAKTRTLRVKWSSGKLTQGERSFVLAHFATAVFGAGVAFAAVMRTGGGAYFSRPMTAYEIWVVLAGAIGAALGLFLNRHRMGQGGTHGAVLALGAVVMSNGTGAVIGGTLALPVYGTMFGPLALVIVLVGSPLLTLIWLASQIAAHLLMARFHDERNSIFVGGPGVAVKPA